VDPERIIAVYQQGHDQEATGAVVGCSREAVVRVTREAGIVRRRRYMPRLDLEEIRRRTEAGQTLEEIANAIGASSTGVQRAMVRAGIPRRPKGGRGRKPRLDVEEIRRRRQAGESVARIARAIGASEIGVKKVVQRYGIPRGSAASSSRPDVRHP
jgi:DNA invertase Pin-like site-specific DNA recombinase